MALELNGTTGVSLVQDGVVTAADLSSTLDLSGKTVTLPAGVGGKVLQVHQFSYSPASTFSTNSGDFTEVTGASTTFTPTQSGGFLIIQAVVPCEGYASGTDVHSYTALFDSSTILQSRGFQGDNLGKLGDLIWLPIVGVHNYKLTHGSTSPRTFNIRLANASTSRQTRVRAGEDTITITVWEIAG